MKRVILIMIATLMVFGSCLDEDPRDRIDEAQASSTATGVYLNFVADLYNYIGGNSDHQGLQGTTRGVYDLNTFTTDEAILPTRGGDWYDGGLWQSLYLHTWTPTTEALEGTWNYLYKVVVKCNQSMEQLENHKSLLNDWQYTSFTSEVRALRAIYYWYLLDLFGNAPYVVSNKLSIDEVVQPTRSQLFYAIWEELNAVAPDLSPIHSNLEGEYYGRITQPVVYFVLAKLALNAEIWTDDDWTDENRPNGSDILLKVEDGTEMNAWKACCYYCTQISKLGYTLEDDYSENFSVYNEESKENIFTIPMDKNLYANQFKNLLRSRHYNHGNAIGMDAENGTSATVSTVLAYGYGTPNEDRRYRLNFFSDTVYVDKKMVLLDNGEPLVYMPLAIVLDLTGETYEKTAGARMSKYEIDRTAYKDGQLQDNDIVLFRYADVLLMMSEAKVRNGENGDQELNMVRQRAGMPYCKATLDNLLRERLIELAWEGWRRQDLIRFDRFHIAYDQRPQLYGEETRYTTVFPIPARALNLNSRLKQNKGY